MNPERDPLVRDQVVRLMGVLRQLAVARNRPIRHHRLYDRALWLEEIRDHCAVQIPEGPGDEVLRVARVPREPEPLMPELIRGWVRRGPDTDDVPEPTVAEEGPWEGEQLYLAEVPEVWRTFDRWMELWRPWAAAERVRRPRLRAFDHLFEMSRLATDRPESIELVLASGLLHVSDEIDVHVITQPVVVEQDPATGEMVCVLAEGTGLRLDDDELLSGLDLYDPSGSAVLRDRLLELAESPIAAGVATFLKEWAPRALTTACQVDDGWVRPAVGALTVAPAVVARRRGSYALRAYYDAAISSLRDEAAPVPLGLAQLVRSYEPEERVAWLQRTGATAPADLAAEPLFPLPANGEQAQIIDRLGGDTGVVVEGPPGTGKTHTIANLVSALLARGQRVLVTSEKAQALRVLRDKLPPSMQELCVSITDATLKGDSDLARSVSTMARRHTEFDPVRAEREIEDLGARRAAAQQSRAALLEDIRALRETETYEHPEIAPGYGGTLASIARALGETRDRHGWIAGFARGPEPIDTAEFSELIELLRADSPRRRSRRNQILPAEPLAPAEFDGLVSAVRHGVEARSGPSGALVSALETLPPDALLQLDPLCTEVIESLVALRGQPGLDRWAGSVVDRLLAGADGHLWSRAGGRLAEVDQALADDTAAGFAHIVVAPGVDLGTATPVLERYADQLATGAAPRRWFRTTEQKDAELLGDTVIVDGRLPTTEGAVRLAVLHMRILAVARRLDVAFQPFGGALDLGADRPVLVQQMLGLSAACAAVDRTVSAAGALRDLLTRLPPFRRPVLGTVSALEQTAVVARRVAHARSAERAGATIDTHRAELVAAVPSGAASPEVDAVVVALDTRDPHAYRGGVETLAVARRERTSQVRCDDLHAALEAALPALGTELVATASDPVWEVRAAGWSAAWARACASAWIAERTATGRERVLDAELDAAVSDVQRLTGDLAAAMAWRTCLDRMTAKQRQALQIYREAVQNLGKGTGKHAERFRRQARGALGVAQASVPAWVMPIQQVLASVPPQPDSFDVVIVDEASQADLTSAFLLWLAPRVIVVGDDKQCTPSEVAAGALQPVFDRIDAELHDIPEYLRTAFNPKNSVFSLLRTRFGQVVRLREHFRSMPEIIAWSSDTFYGDGPLEALRQFGADRLPPLRTTHVVGASAEYSSGSVVVNRAEAAAIVDSVVACAADPAYDGRTFGVVVLQGHAQVDLIRTLLIDRLDAEAWRTRRLRVGTPPDFQGDERHVVWMSMVTAPDSPRYSAVRRPEQQRYNVAASRAQDQLWLFHSVTADLLSRDDLRRSLLTHMLGTGAGLDPVITDVDRRYRRPPFDSLFEQRVHLDLLARGYHVTPQVESNRRRIDLVITGTAGRLAVDCDGEALHSTPEQRDADLQREQELKRCGWTFERIRESAYHIDPDAALAPVFTTLDRLGIAPLGEFEQGSWTLLASASVPAGAVHNRVDAVVDSPPIGETGELRVVPPAAPTAEAHPPEPEPSRTREIPAAPPGPSPVSVDVPVRADPPEPPLPTGQAGSAFPQPSSRPRPERPRVGVWRAADPPAQKPRPATPLPSGPREGASTGNAQRQPEEPPEAVVRSMLLQRAAVSPLTTRWVADFLAIGLQEARDQLARLQDEGAIRKVGAGRGTRYVLTSRSAVTPAAHRDPVRDSINMDRVVRAAGYRPMTRERVHQLLGLTLSQATEILQVLTTAGRLERRGVGRGTAYVPVGSQPATPPSAPPVTEVNLAEADLDSALHDLADRIETEGQVTSPLLRRLLDAQGAVGALNTLIRPGGPSYGFVELWKAQRLDLTVEAFVTARPELHALLDPFVVGHARARLEEFRATPSGASVTAGSQWVQTRGAAGGHGSVAWVLRRQQWAQPWPHSELGRGFTFLVADRRREGFVVTAQAAVTAYLPFVEVTSLGQAHRMAEHILAPAGLTYAVWQAASYNQRRLTAGKWPLHFSCWVVRERPVPARPVRPDDDGEATGTGWFQTSAR